jgi:hypothetical protein
MGRPKAADCLSANSLLWVIFWMNRHTNLRWKYPAAAFAALGAGSYQPLAISINKVEARYLAAFAAQPIAISLGQLE